MGADPTPQPGPHLTLPDPIEVMLDFRICFFGFDQGSSIDASIQASDGSEVTAAQLTGAGDNGTLWAWTAYPDDAVGPDNPYTVTASQNGAIVASAMITVQLATDQRTAVKPPAGATTAVGPPGTTFSLVLAGFDPGTTLPLYLYACQEGAILRCDFVRDLSSVRLDDNGQGVFSLPTSTEDPVGLFAVGYGANEGAVFRLA